MIFTEQLNNWYLRASVDFTEYDFKIAVSPFKTDVSAFKLERSCYISTTKHLIIPYVNVLAKNHHSLPNKENKNYIIGYSISHVTCTQKNYLTTT